MFKHEKAKKTPFKWELLEKFNINIDEDSSETHPEKICPPCKQLLYCACELGNAAKVSVSRTIERWTSHMDSNCQCTSGKKKASGKKKSPLRAVS